MAVDDGHYAAMYKVRAAARDDAHGHDERQRLHQTEVNEGKPVHPWDGVRLIAQCDEELKDDNEKVGDVDRLADVGDNRLADSYCGGMKVSSVSRCAKKSITI